MTVLYADFDGMREANNALGFEEGGDFLIRTVAQAIPTLLLAGEMVARVHVAGDEFVCILRPGEKGHARSTALEHTSTDSTSPTHTDLSTAAPQSAGPQAEQETHPRHSSRSPPTACAPASTNAELNHEPRQNPPRLLLEGVDASG